MSFSKQIQAHTAKVRRRLKFVARDAVQTMMTDVQLATTKGGRMRVDTGFLRASMQANIGAMPSGPSQNLAGITYTEGQQVAGQPLAATLLRWDPAQDALYIGWTANYARWREYQDGFMRGGTERWSEYVNQSVQKAQGIL